MNEVVTDVSPVSDAVEVSSQAVGDSLQVFQDVLSQGMAVGNEYLPAAVSTVLILVLGYIFAKILSWVTSGVLSKTGLDDKLSAYTGSNLSKSSGLVAFYTVMTFVLLAVLKTLNLDTVSQPITDLLTRFFEFIPNLVGAGVLLTVFALIGKVAGNLAQQALSNTSADSLAAEYLGEDTSASSMVGEILKYSIVFMGVTQATDILGLEVLSNFVSQVWSFVTPIAIGTGIFAVGASCSTKISKFVTPLIPELVREQAATYIPQAIVGLAAIVGLRQTGLVDNLIDVVIPIMVAAGGLAVALRYGLNKE